MPKIFSNRISRFFSLTFLESLTPCIISSSPSGIITQATTTGPASSIIKGDAKSYSIACASIVAKVTRDRYMAKMDEVYPQYATTTGPASGPLPTSSTPAIYFLPSAAYCRSYSSIVNVSVAKSFAKDIDCKI